MRYFLMRGSEEDEKVHAIEDVAPPEMREPGTGPTYLRVLCTSIRACHHGGEWEVIDETELVNRNPPREAFCTGLGCKHALKPFIGASREVKLPGGGT